MYVAMAPLGAASKRAKRRMVMFSLIEPIISCVFCATVSPLPGHVSLPSSSTELALLRRITFATSAAKLRKPSVRATKSVSQLTSTSTPTLPSTTEVTIPSAVMRPAFLLAVARPFLRRMVRASSMSPLASTSAALTSIMPAPVCSRSSLTIFAVISAIDTSATCSGARLGRRRPKRPLLHTQRRRKLLGNRGRRSHHFGRNRFGRHRRFGRSLFGLVLGSDVPLLGDVVALEHSVGDLLREQADRADRVVVARNDVIDVFRIAVRVDDGHHGDAQLLRFLDRDVLLLRVDDEERVGQAVHLADADQVLLQLFPLAIERGALFLRQLLLRVVEDSLY